MSSIANISAEHLNSRATIRKAMRRKRICLGHAQLLLAERAIAKRLTALPALMRARRVLSYSSFAGEVSPQEIERALPHADIFQPRIISNDKGLMRFYPKHGRKTRNKFGMLEPAAIGSPLPAMQLDAVLVPLVAFDRSGNRLGMGAGFYDRAFSFRLRNKHGKRPMLIGLAHHFQEVNSLAAQSWDVPLDAILTDQELIKIS